MLTKVSNLRVDGLIYLVSEDRVSVLWLHNGNREVTELGTVREFLPRVERLRDDLSNPNKMSGGNTSQLEAFITDWGRRLLPATFPPSELDAVVIVPHAMLHTLLFHLVYSPGLCSHL